MSKLENEQVERSLDIVDLDDLCTEIIDCPHSTPKWQPHGIRVIRNFNLENGRISFSKASYVDEETYLDRTRRATPEQGDIIVSREAPVGAVGLVPPNLRCCLGQRLVLLKVDRSKCTPEYLIAALTSGYVKKQFERANSTGSTVSNLTIPALRKLRIPITANAEAVGRINQLLNEKLSVNSQLTTLLLDFASNQFLHRFLRKPTNGTLAEIITELPKSKIKVSDAKEVTGDFPLFTSGASILRWDSALAKCRATLLNTGGNADVKFYSGPLAYSTDTWAITAPSGFEEYLFLLLRTIRPELDRKYFQGTGLKHLQKPLLKKRPIYIPSREEIEEFNGYVKPALSLFSELLREEQDLKKLQNWYLPLLMTGQASAD